MKKMISNMKTMAALLMAGAAFTACSSSDDNFEQPVKPTEQQVYTLVIQASKGSDAMTRALNGDYTYTWDGTETFDVVQDGAKIGTATAAASATNETTITATLSSAPSESDVIEFFLHGAAMDWTGQVGLLTGTNSISEKYDYANAALYSGDFTVSGNNIVPESSASLTFRAMQFIVKFTLQNKSGSAISATKLNIHSSADGLVQKVNSLTKQEDLGDLTITPTDPASTIYAAMIFFGGDMTLTASDGNGIYSYTKSSPVLFPGNYYDITVKMNKILARVTGGTVNAVFGGGYKAISEDDARALAMQCYTVADGPVYVVYSASGTPGSPNVSYAYTTDGTTTDTGTATSFAEVVALYAGGNTAWFVEP